MLCGTPFAWFKNAGTGSSSFHLTFTFSAKGVGQSPLFSRALRHVRRHREPADHHRSDTGPSSWSCRRHSAHRAQDALDTGADRATLSAPAHRIPYAELALGKQ